MPGFAKKLDRKAAEARAAIAETTIAKDQASNRSRTTTSKGEEHDNPQINQRQQIKRPTRQS
jgi:hypothetical protein